MKKNNMTIERFRITEGMLGSSESSGNNGMFSVDLMTGVATVVVSDGLGWEHVSVSFPLRVPTWDEMCVIKDLFWGDDEVVIQYHPAKSDYVNNHNHCLHLWKPIGIEIPVPPSLLVGMK